MSDRARLGWAIAIGAAVGGAIGYLFFTEHGRRLRVQLEPRMADLLDELKKWQGTLDEAKSFAFGAGAERAGADDWTGEQSQPH